MSVHLVGCSNLVVILLVLEVQDHVHYVCAQNNSTFMEIQYTTSSM